MADLALLSGLVQSGEAAIGLTAADALRLLPPDDSLHTVQQYPACGAGTGQKIYSGAVLLPADQISLRAYPNPADDIVQFLASGFGEGAELVVYSTLGLRVAAMPVGSGRSFEINVNKLRPGAYVCVLQDAAGRTARQRLVISR